MYFMAIIIASLCGAKVLITFNSIADTWMTHNTYVLDLLNLENLKDSNTIIVYKVLHSQNGQNFNSRESCDNFLKPPKISLQKRHMFDS